MQPQIKALFDELAKRIQNLEDRLKNPNVELGHRRIFDHSHAGEVPKSPNDEEYFLGAKGWAIPPTGSGGEFTGSFAVIFSGSQTIMSNRVSQAYTAPGLLGATNFGSSIATVTADYATVGGGSGNSNAGHAATIGGGIGNRIKNSWYATIGGGLFNQLDNGSDGGTISGGTGNSGSGDHFIIAGGENNVATGDHSSVFGQGCEATGQYATAIGVGAEAIGDFSVAMGDGPRAIGEDSVALGSGCETNGEFSIAAGNGAITEADNSVSMGNGTTTRGPSSVAFGNGAQANGDSSFSVGNGCVADGESSAALNYGWARGTGSLSVNSSYTFAENAFAAGNTQAGGMYSSTFGLYCSGSRNGQFTYGYGQHRSREFADSEHREYPRIGGFGNNIITVAGGDCQTSMLMMLCKMSGNSPNETFELMYGQPGDLVGVDAGVEYFYLEDMRAYTFRLSVIAAAKQGGSFVSRTIESRFNARCSGGLAVVTAMGPWASYGDDSTADWRVTVGTNGSDRRLALRFQTGATASSGSVSAKLAWEETKVY